MPPHSAVDVLERHHTAANGDGPAVDEIVSRDHALITTPRHRDARMVSVSRPALSPMASTSAHVPLGEVPSDAMLWMFLRKQKEMDRTDTAPLRQRILHRAFLIDVRVRCEAHRAGLQRQAEAAAAAAAASARRRQAVMQKSRLVVDRVGNDEDEQASSEPQRQAVRNVVSGRRADADAPRDNRKRPALTPTCQDGADSDQEDEAREVVKRPKVHFYQGPAAMPIDAF